MLFIVFTTVSVLASTALLISDNLAAWAVLGGSCLLAIVVYVASRTIGLTGMSHDLGHWTEPDSRRVSSGQLAAGEVRPV